MGFHTPSNTLHVNQGCTTPLWGFACTMMCRAVSAGAGVRAVACGPIPWLAVCELPRALAAAGGRRPAAPTSLYWPGRAGLLLWLTSAGFLATCQALNYLLHRVLEINRETNPMPLYFSHSFWLPSEKQRGKKTQMSHTQITLSTCLQNVASARTRTLTHELHR